MAFATMETRDGAIWITTVDGVSRWSGEAFVNYRSGIDLPRGNWRTLAQGNDGSVWIGSLDDGVVKYDNGRFTPYRSRDGLPSDHVRSLFVARNADLWVASDEGTVASYAG